MMLTQFVTIGTLTLLSAMLPGPDFAMVTKNTVLHSRRAGVFTSLGIASAILVHISYCLLGLAVVISQSILLFNTIKYIGALYLIYLGLHSLFAKDSKETTHPSHQIFTRNNIADFTAFRHGFLCNLLNPKATLFFLALFTVIIKPQTPIFLELIYAVEIVLVIACWFCTLTLLLSHPRVLRLLNKVEKYIAKILGLFLIGFGVALSFVKK